VRLRLRPKASRTLRSVPPPHFRAMAQARLLAGIALLTVLAVTGLDPYLYGLYNHNITVPFLWRTVDAAAYPHDPLVDQ
jgi:hypothetical protein